MLKQSAYVIVAMSGGVDSSVAAYLLQQQGYRVEGLFMKNWEEDDTDTYCAASKDLQDAQTICDHLNIQLHRINFAAEYWDDVFTHFLEEFQAGRTPNPDIACNREIKFKAFLNHALTLGADYIATGHYSRIIHHDGHYQLLSGIDPNKDQSYFLYALGQKQLSRSLFPIGNYKKPQIRNVAKQLGFHNHDRKSSTGICFIGPRKFKEFLERYLPAQTGNIETVEGHMVGKHEGLMHYTIGQRQGLGIGGYKNGIEAPWYVVAKDLNRNVLIVTQGDNHPALFAYSLIFNQANWIAGNEPKMPLQCNAKTRYRQVAQTCELNKLDATNYQLDFIQPQRAITPGQSVVLYQNDECLGGGIIIRSLCENKIYPI